MCDFSKSELLIAYLCLSVPVIIFLLCIFKKTVIHYWNYGAPKVLNYYNKKNTSTGLLSENSKNESKINRKNFNIFIIRLTYRFTTILKKKLINILKNVSNVQKLIS